MKRGSNKLKVILVCVLSFLFLTGYFWWWETVPKLINADKPFVDLAGSIGESIGSANAAYENAILTPVPTETPKPTAVPVPTSVPDNMVDGKEEIRIVIGDEVMSGPGELILFNGVKIEDTEKLRKLVTSEDYTDKSYVLVDYYAETGMFKSVEEILRNSGRAYKKETIKDREIDSDR